MSSRDHKATERSRTADHHRQDTRKPTIATATANINGLNTQSGSQCERQWRSFKLLIDPMIKKGQQKLYRYDGVIQGRSDYAPVPTRDPRNRLSRLWPRTEKAELPVPKFEFDEYYVGELPPKEVTFSNLNDNISTQFLEEMCKKFGIIELSKIYHHPKTKKHLGLGRVKFSTVMAAKQAVTKLNRTSVMGNIIIVQIDTGGKECDQMFECLIDDKPKMPTVQSLNDPRSKSRIPPSTRTPETSRTLLDRQGQSNTPSRFSNQRFAQNSESFTPQSQDSGYSTHTAFSTDYPSPMPQNVEGGFRGNGNYNYGSTPSTPSTFVSHSVSTPGVQSYDTNKSVYDGNKTFMPNFAPPQVPPPPPPQQPVLPPPLPAQSIPQYQQVPQPSQYQQPLTGQQYQQHSHMTPKASYQSPYHPPATVQQSHYQQPVRPPPPVPHYPSPTLQPAPKKNVAEHYTNKEPVQRHEKKPILAPPSTNEKSEVIKPAESPTYLSFDSRIESLLKQSRGKGAFSEIPFVTDSSDTEPSQSPVTPTPPALLPAPLPPPISEPPPHVKLSLPPAAKPPLPPTAKPLLPSVAKPPLPPEAKLPLLPAAKPPLPPAVKPIKVAKSEKSLSERLLELSQSSLSDYRSPIESKWDWRKQSNEKQSVKQSSEKQFVDSPNRTPLASEDAESKDSFGQGSHTQTPDDNTTPSKSVVTDNKLEEETASTVDVILTPVVVEEEKPSKETEEDVMVIGSVTSSADMDISDDEMSMSPISSHDEPTLEVNLPPPLPFNPVYQLPNYSIPPPGFPPPPTSASQTTGIPAKPMDHTKPPPLMSINVLHPVVPPGSVVSNFPLPSTSLPLPISFGAHLPPPSYPPASFPAYNPMYPSLTPDMLMRTGMMWRPDLPNAMPPLNTSSMLPWPQLLPPMHPQVQTGQFPDWNENAHSLTPLPGFDPTVPPPGYQPKTDPNQETIDKILEKSVSELKQIMKRDLCRRMVELSAFKALENWWDKNAQEARQPSVKTEQDEQKPAMKSKPVPAMTTSSWAKSMSSGNTMGELNMENYGLGLRATMPKMPSFKMKRKIPSPVDDDDDDDEEEDDDEDGRRIKRRRRPDTPTIMDDSDSDTELLISRKRPHSVISDDEESEPEERSGSESSSEESESDESGESSSGYESSSESEDSEDEEEAEEDEKEKEIVKMSKKKKVPTATLR